MPKTVSQRASRMARMVDREANLGDMDIVNKLFEDDLVKTPVRKFYLVFSVLYYFALFSCTIFFNICCLGIHKSCNTIPSYYFSLSILPVLSYAGPPSRVDNSGGMRDPPGLSIV